MKFLKDLFYINYHERRALLIILTLLVVSTTMIFIVGSKETMPSENNKPITIVSSGMPRGNIQAIMKTDFSRAKYSPLTPIRQANLISNGWDWNHGKPEASSNIEIKEVSSGHQETLHGFTD